MRINRLTVEHMEKNCITDEERPRFSFAIESENPRVTSVTAKITVNGWSAETSEQILIPYGGERLLPFTRYSVTVEAVDNYGERAFAETYFETGRMGEPWSAKWITDGGYRFTEKRVSPVPMLFKKKISLKKPISRAVIYSTAMGIYGLEINGKRVGDDYFAPGFTSYKSYLQYQAYDVTDMLTGDDELTATVAGGWAVGSFVFTRKNRITSNRQALLLEMRIAYADGSGEVIKTDESWQVTLGGKLRAADLYDGEIYDATVDLSRAEFHAAAHEKLRVNPQIIASYGSAVKAHEEFSPVSVKKLASGALVYDFGQNLAGVVRAEIKGVKGRKIVFKHAEILREDGSANTSLLRSAKATAEYVCTDGEQVYSPRFTYMGFRFVEVSGASESDLRLTAIALYSDVREIGSFECSNELINKLQKNIVWSAKSNFVDIPTDCPQRDERMGWTGDIAAFADTACFNFEASRFLEKWLKDLRAEQLKTGGIPNTVPVQGYGFPATMPKMAVDFWGDACVLVPWALYMAGGDRRILEISYDSMKRYLKACGFWARLLSFGKQRYVWRTPHSLHFGDWLSPDLNKMSDWQKRSPLTATASYANTAKTVSRVAEILGKTEDAEKFRALFEKISDAYASVFTDKRGKLKKEFQTGYVLPLQFKMFPESVAARAAANLAALVEKNDFKIATGFPGTQYVLFALADNGQAETAFKMLENTECPSWLFEVRAGGTTVWERFDGLKADGTLNAGESDGTGGMISFNHYASGSVGAFLYRRVAGICPTEAGYKKFTVKPLIGGSLSFARAEVDTPYGVIKSSWEIRDGEFTLRVEIPACTECEIVLPNGESAIRQSGKYQFSVRC